MKTSRFAPRRGRRMRFMAFMMWRMEDGSLLRWGWVDGADVHSFGGEVRVGFLWSRRYVLSDDFYVFEISLIC